MKKMKRIFLFMAALMIVGVLGFFQGVNATPEIRNTYDTVHGNPVGSTSCSFCHTTPPALNATGQTLLDSNFDYCSIGPPTGQCAQAPLINSFTASPSSISSGQSSTLSWSLSGGAPTTLTIDNAVGSVLGLTSMVVTPSVTTIYTLTASNGAGTATRSVTVTLAVGVTPPVINSFIATPSMINSGQSSTLSWTLSGGAPTTLTIDNGVGSVLGLISTVVTPATTTTYTLTATNSAGSDQQSVTVQVNGTVMAPVIISFTAAPNPILPGQSSTLSWTLSGGAPTTLTIDNGVGSVLGLTSTIVTPSVTTTYTLTASNSAGGATQSVTVTVSGTAVTIWEGPVSFYLMVSTVQPNRFGKMAFKNSSDFFAGTVTLMAGPNGLTKSAEGCFLKFLETDGTGICIDNIAAISSDLMRGKGEQTLIIGSGIFTTMAGGQPVTGPAYFDAILRLKEDTSNNPISLDLNGRLVGGVDSASIFRGQFKTILTPLP